MISIHGTKKIFLTVAFFLGLIIAINSTPSYAASLTLDVSPRNQNYGDLEKELHREKVITPKLAQKPNGLSLEKPDSPNPYFYSTLAYQLESESGSFLYKCIGYSFGTQSNCSLLFLGNGKNYHPRLNSQASEIAFTSYLNGNADVYTIRPDGTGLLRITSSVAYDGNPVWSPDGLKIAFVSKRDGNQEIYLTNSDGSGQVRLTFSPDEDFSPTWSPDGQYIAWVRKVSETQGQVWVMKSDGSNAVTITPLYSYINDLVWSPYGNEIGFDMDHNGDGWNNAFIMNSSGQVLQMIPKIGGDQYQDIIFNSWAVVNDYCLLSILSYTPIGSNYVLSRVNIIQEYLRDPVNPSPLDLIIPRYDPYGLIGFTMAPTTGSTDLQRPVTTFAPLKQYSSAAGFQILANGFDVGVSGMFSITTLAWVTPGSMDTTALSPEVYSILGTTDGKLYTSALVSGKPGTTVKVVTSGIDYAANQEVIVERGDNTTTLYKYRVFGQARDLRDRPLLGQTLTTPRSLNQTTSTDDGNYTAYYSLNPVNELQLSGSLISKPLVIRDPSQIDKRIDLIPPANDNLVTNGDFEDVNPLTGWSVSGDISPTTFSSYEGGHAINLGSCDGTLCMKLESHPHPSSQAVSMVEDYLGNLHITQGNYYYFKSPDGTWSIPSLILTDGQSVYHTYLDIDENNVLHVFAFTGNDIVHLTKVLVSPWQIIETIHYAGSVQAVFIDYGGIINLAERISGGGNSIKLLRRNGNSTWSEVASINSTGFSTAKAPDGSIYILKNGSGMNCLTVFQPDGSVHTENCPFPVSIKPRLAIDGLGGVHILNGVDDYYYSTVHSYYYRDPQKEWFGPVAMQQNLSCYSVEMKASKNGDVWIAYLQHSSPQLTFVHKSPLDISFEVLQTNFAFGSTQPVTIFFDHQDGLYLGSDSNLLMPASASSETTSELSHTFTIPLSVHEPTLSFLYRIDGSVAGRGDSFRVELIPEGEAAVTLFSTGSPTMGWAHQWYDLNAFLGKSVNIKFSLSNFLGAPSLTAHLDQVAVGSWTTPVISEISPHLLNAPVPVSTPLIIQGENFIGGSSSSPQVKVAGFTIDAIWIDINHLEIQLPAPLEAGDYDVEVINPGGYKAILHNGLMVRSMVYLPVTQK
jgi:hypothetical protein